MMPVVGIGPGRGKVATEITPIDKAASSQDFSDASLPKEEVRHTKRSPRSGKTPRVALVNLDDASQRLFHESFDKFGIATVAVQSETGDFFHKENFQGCVLTLR